MPEQVLKKWLARIVAGLQKSKYTRFETFITDIVSNPLNEKRDANKLVDLYPFNSFFGGRTLKLSLDLSENEVKRLQATAKRLNVPIEKLAKAALTDLLHSDADFEHAAEHVLKKNRELYRRLS